jgi:exonuclease SbcC
MWKLDNIHAENLCAFKELDYTLEQGVTTLVFGNNLDNDSQKSNGSGKSALIETIAIGIGGTPLRKIKNEEIINDAADECFIRLEFLNDSSTEVFVIERKISRKSASVVKCSIIRDEKPIETDEAVRSSVSEYDKYILEKLGINKDELYNNFVLSKHKFQDFLSCSDKEKKEIINRFSNGILVDKAIEKLEEDMVPLQNELNEANLNVANIDGRVSMLQEQIEAEENAKEERAKTKLQKIEEKKSLIVSKRAEIRKYNEDIDSINAALDHLDNVDGNLQTIEENDKIAPNEAVERIVALFKEASISGLSDWKQNIAEKEQSILSLEKKLEENDASVSVVESQLNGLKEDYDTLSEDYKKFSSKYPGRLKEYDDTIALQQQEIVSLTESVRQNIRDKRSLNIAIEELKTKLAGTIKCPKCSHEFLLSDKDFNVEEAEKELALNKQKVSDLDSHIKGQNDSLAEYENQIDKVKSLKSKLREENMNWEEKLSSVQSSINRLKSKTNDLNLFQKTTSDKIAMIQGDLNNIRKKIFDEAFNLLDDEINKKERAIKQLKETISTTEGSIDTLQQTIKELKEASDNEIIESLRLRLKEFLKKSVDAVSEKSKIEVKLNALKEQGQRFVEFKTYLANTKIEALSKITNEFLENIGSDIRIRFSGYTILKTGKLRDKISISIIRDGIDSGSFGKLSEGEKARVNLANILAMHKLINVNCDGDKGLDLLVLDEILEAVDENGLANMFSAINHIGVTALVVSHGNVAENYPYKLIINKQNGESYIDENH